MDDYIERDGAISIVSYCECYHAVRALEELPAADVAPVRHARWGRLAYDVAACTACGYDIVLPFHTWQEAIERWSELPNYCADCGAKMDEKEDTHDG